MVKKALLISILLVSALTCYARKQDYPIEVLAGKAQLILVGEIQAVRAESYIFKISNTVKGAVKTQTIEVQKFKEWVCDTRYAPHEVGQKLFLFLTKYKRQWHLIDGGNAEKPIINDTITLRQEQEHIKGEYHPWKIKFSEFYEAIRSFSNSYRYKGVYDFMTCTCTFVRTESDERSLYFIETPFAKYLLAKMTGKYYKVVNK